MSVGSDLGLVPIDEFCRDTLKVKLRTGQRLRDRDGMPVVKIGKFVFVRPESEAFRRWLESREQQANPPPRRRGGRAA